MSLHYHHGGDESSAPTPTVLPTRTHHVDGDRDEEDERDNQIYLEAEVHLGEGEAVGRRETPKLEE